MTWILIIFVYAGILSKGDSVAITNVPGFSTEQECIAAGEKSISLGKGTFKDVKYICIKQRK